MSNENKRVLDEHERVVKQVFLIGCSVKVTGRTTKKSAGTVARDGEALEREYEVEERIENTAQYARANKLAGRLRQLADRHGSSTKYGFLASPAGAAAFEAELNQLIESEIAAHNAEAGQTAIVTPDPVVVPIGVSFGERDVRSILDQIAGEIAAQRAALEVGNTDAVTTWLKRGQRLTGLLPGLNATVVASAIEALREAKNVIAARVRTHFADADAYKATLGKPLDNDAILKDALQCVEWDHACGQVEAALGWLQPAPAIAPATAVAS